MTGGMEANTATAPERPLLLRREAVAAMLSVTVRTVDLMAQRGTLRRVYIPGLKSARYAREDVERLVEEAAKEGSGG